MAQENSIRIFEQPESGVLGTAVVEHYMDCMERDVAPNKLAARLIRDLVQLPEGEQLIVVLDASGDDCEDASALLDEFRNKTPERLQAAIHEQPEGEFVEQTMARLARGMVLDLKTDQLAPTMIEGVENFLDYFNSPQ